MRLPSLRTAARLSMSFIAGRASSLLLVFSLCLPLAAHAVGALTLAEALRIATQESPLLSAQRSAIAAAGEMAVAAGELPDPKLRLGLDNLPVDGADRYSLTRDFMTMRKIGVMQEFPRAEKREIRSRRAGHELAREQAALADVRAALRRDVALSWMERYFAERMSRIVDGQYAEAELQLQAMQSGLRAGKTQPADLLALQVGLQSLLDRRAEFEKQAARAKALLSRWLGEAAAWPLAQLSAAPVPGRQHELAQHVSQHPHLQTLERQVEIAQSDAALAKAATQPDWGLEVAYAQRGPQYSNMLSVQVSIDLPLFQARRQDRGIAAKLAQVEQARAMKEDSQRQHLAEANAAWAEWDAATARLKRFDDALLPLAHERALLALAAYRGGQGSLASTLEARRAEIELRLQQLQLAAEQGRAYAQLLYFLPEENLK
ncbi:MAG: TolC family protein [Pseudomonadota bacterium]